MPGACRVPLFQVEWDRGGTAVGPRWDLPVFVGGDAGADDVGAIAAAQGDDDGVTPAAAPRIVKRGAPASSVTCVAASARHSATKPSTASGQSIHYLMFFRNT